MAYLANHILPQTSRLRVLRIKHLGGGLRSKEYSSIMGETGALSGRDRLSTDGKRARTRRPSFWRPPRPVKTASLPLSSSSDGFIHARSVNTRGATAKCHAALSSLAISLSEGMQKPTCDALIEAQNTTYRGVYPKGLRFGASQIWILGRKNGTQSGTVLRNNFFSGIVLNHFVQALLLCPRM